MGVEERRMSNLDARFEKLQMLSSLREQAEDIINIRFDKGHDNESTKIRRLLHELHTYQIELELQNEDLRQAQVKLLDTQKKYTDLYDFAPAGYLTISGKGLMVEINLTLAGMLGLGKRFLLNQPFSAHISPEDQDIYYHCRRTLLESKTLQTCELRMMKKDGATFHAKLRCSINPEVDGSSDQFRAVITDITERKKIEEEKEIFISELQTALKEIKTLRGLIPICAFCKQIRNDEGAWDQMEAYITEHTHAEFSHGICPDCAKKHYPEMNLYDFDKKN